MEFLNGGDLFSLLSVHQCFPNNFAQFYIAEALLSLEYLHKRGIIHRGLFFLFIFYYYYYFIIYFIY